MREQQFTAILVAQMKAAFQNSVVFKHADRSTIGIPDISCTWRDRTLWIEAKYLRSKDTKDFPMAVDFSKLLLSKDEKVQLDTMRRLDIQSCSFYLMYMKKQVLYARARVAADLAYKKIASAVNEYSNWRDAIGNETIFLMPRNNDEVLRLIAHHFGVNA